MVASQLPGQILAGGEFFTYALPWLLTFAIVYGFLNHYEMPESDAAQAVISIVFAFFVLPVAAPVVSYLRQIGASLVVISTGIIFFLILLELTQTKHEGDMIVEKHAKAFAIIVAIIVLLIFHGAGGFEAVGFSNIIPTMNWPTIFFLVIIILAIWFMVNEGNGEEEGEGE